MAARYRAISATPQCRKASLTRAPIAANKAYANGIQKDCMGEGSLLDPIGRPRDDALQFLHYGTANGLSQAHSPMARASTPKPVAELTFEQALDELDALVRRMETGELNLDDAIAAYRRGAELARYCQSKLAAAEQEIRQLDGEMLRPLDPSELRGGGQ